MPEHIFSSNAGEYRPENTPYLDTFHTVYRSEKTPFLACFKQGTS